MRTRTSAITSISSSPYIGFRATVGHQNLISVLKRQELLLYRCVKNAYVIFRSSPEVITNGEYSKASDMWAFGVMIWEMFTLIDKDLQEISDKKITPYYQLMSKDQVRFHTCTCPTKR